MKDLSNIKIAVAGTGYVGLSIATLLAQHHRVTAVNMLVENVYTKDIFQERLNKDCTIHD